MKPSALDRFSDRFLAPELRGDHGRENQRARRLVLVVFAVVAIAPALALLLWIKGATPWSTMVLLMALAAAVWSYETLSEAMRLRIARSDEAMTSVRSAAEADSRELRWILDSLSLGVITVDSEGFMALERSAAVDDLFGEPALGAKLWDYLGTADPGFAKSLSSAWSTLHDGKVPADFALIQLPRKLMVRDRQFELEYRRMHSGERLSTILVVIADVTSEVARERAELELFETRSVLSQLHRDRSGVMTLFEQAGLSVTRLTRQSSRFDRRATLLEIQALQEPADALGMASLATFCQNLDARVRDTRSRLTADERATLLSLWSVLVSRFEPWLGDAGAQELHVSADDQASLRQAILGQAARTELLWLVDRWKHEPVVPRLLRVAESARSTARRIGKGQVDVAVTESSARVDPSVAGKFWTALTHTVRDALEHELDRPSLTGPQPDLALELRAYESEGDTIIEVEGGFSFSWSASAEIMAKLRATCEGAGGGVRLLEEADQGTTLQCRLPMMGARLSVTLPPMTTRSRSSRELEGGARAAG